MAEYIEREARLKEIDTAFKEYGQRGDILKLFSECRASIIYAPAADVVEVRRGEWETTDTPLGRCCICSVCGSCPTMEYRYCPYCGAKMDGKGE